MIRAWVHKKKAARQGEPPNTPLTTPPQTVEDTYPNRSLEVVETIGGEYAILDVFQGRLGPVYVVRHHELAHPIVLKSLLQSADRKARRSLAQDAETWIRIGIHPNIVQAYWVREIQGQLFLATEFIAPDEMGRRSVADFVRLGPLPPQVVLKWVVQFCYGMEQANRQGVQVYGDIQPRNLMVDPLGDLKITDLGLARHAGGDQSATSPYRAPEQIIGDPAIDPRADIFGLGVSMYEMCTGRPPFDEQSPAEVGHEQLDPTGTALDPLISKCLAKQPEDRFQTVDELLDAAATLAQELEYPLPDRPLAVTEQQGDLYVKALSYSATGEPQLAMKLLDEYLTLRPDDYRGWIQKSRLCRETGRMDEAAEAIRRSLELNPINASAWNNLGLILTRQSRGKAAAQAFDRARELDPALAPARTVLEVLEVKTTRPDPARLLQQGRVMEAKHLLMEMTTADTASATDWHNLGLIFLQEDNTAKARECFDNVLRFDPEDDFALQQMMNLHAEAGEFEAALTYCESLGALPKHAVPALLKKAQLLQALDRDEEAINVLQQCLANDRSLDQAWFNLGVVCQRCGRNYEALDAFARCERLIRHNPFARENLQVVREHIAHLRTGSGS